MKPLDMTLYFITDSTCVPEDRFLPVVEAAFKGGATIIKKSEKEITNVDLLRRISQLEKIILGKEQQ